MILFLILVVLVVAIAMSLATPFTRAWGYGYTPPFGVLGILLVALLILWATGHSFGRGGWW